MIASLFPCVLRFTGQSPEKMGLGRPVLLEQGQRVCRCESCHKGLNKKAPPDGRAFGSAWVLAAVLCVYADFSQL